MPKGTRVRRCVQKVKSKRKSSYEGEKVNAYAACQKSTGQNYRTGKPLKR